MKITRLEIADYQQFKDFAIDLTYPAGHPKAGEPLDKICLIGQSGTGKTTILNVISELFNNFGSTIISQENREIVFKINYFLYNKDFSGEVMKCSLDKGNRYGYYNQSDFNKFNNLKTTNSNVFYTYVDKNTSTLKSFCMYLQTGLERAIQAILGELQSQAPLIHTKENDTLFLAKIEDISVKYLLKNVIESTNDFTKEDFRIFLLKSLDEYDRKLKENIEKLVDESVAGNLDKFVEKVKLLKTKNPRIELSKKLAPILENFNVKIDAEWAKGGIRLKTLQDTDFEMNVASTGTKHILLSSLPLALLETAHKVILFDEPECSLYPDIQRVIIKHYTDLAPEAQFFFATHSPLIASQFEPWEIVELKFNEEGKVYRELYYKGENHVDNYTIFPQYLSWDSILTKVFDLEVRGNEKHQTKLKELAILEVKLRNAPQEQKRAIWEQYEKLANLLDWQIDK